MYATYFVQVGQNIQNAIKERGFTQQRLADALSVSKQVVNKIVKGQKAINVSELSRIATILGTTTDMLLSVETVIDLILHTHSCIDVKLSKQYNIKRGAVHIAVPFFTSSFSRISYR